MGTIRRIKHRIARFYVDHVFYGQKNRIDLTGLFDLLRPLRYAVIKTDTPYTPIGFPNFYPVGKDLDMVCLEEDFENINQILEEFSRRYSNVIIKRKHCSYQVRFEKWGVLHYLLDNNCYSSIDPLYQVVAQGLHERTLNGNGYFKFPPEYEAILRLQDVALNPSKQYHIEFINKHIEKMNKNLIPEDLLPTYEKVLEQSLT